jgi:hypothetical protein
MLDLSNPEGLGMNHTQPESADLQDQASVLWAINRHELVAGAAESFLTPKASGEVERIVRALGTSTSLRSLAGWADRIKRREPNQSDDADTVTFLKDARNATQDTWHYVNLPAEAEVYDRARYPTFTRDDDVVQMTIAAIDCLKDGSDRFIELNALRLLTHYVGDVHQPIHVGCGYVDRSRNPPTLVLDPDIAAAKSLPHDRGGGRILLPQDASGKSLHEYWDGMGRIDVLMGTDALASESNLEVPAVKENFVRKLVEMVRSSQTSRFSFVSGGDIEPRNRVQIWTTTSLEGAHQAYQSLQPIGESNQSVLVSWEGKAAYDARCRPIANRQLTRAAHNLASLLNDIWS